MKAKECPRHAVVTGATSGIGYALAQQLLDKGTRLVSWSRRKPDITHQNFHHVTTDVREYSSVTEAHAETISLLDKRIDFLVNNAGIGAFGPLEEVSNDTWDDLFDTNLKGVFYCSRCMIPHMRKQGFGHIVQVGSIAGLRGVKGMAAYCATKHALRGLSESMMLELREHGIKVSYIAPGTVETPFLGKVGFQAVNAQDLMQPAHVAETITGILYTDARYLPSLLELRPMHPPVPKEIRP